MLVHLQRLIREIYPLIRVFMGRGRNGPFLLSQVKRKLEGFTELIRENTFDECSYENVKSRGKKPQFSS
jgi:hypothetical protein